MQKISSDLTLEEKNLRNLKTHAEGVISDNIGAICVDDNGLVWMGSQGWGCIHYDLKPIKWKTYLICLICLKKVF